MAIISDYLKLYHDYKISSIVEKRKIDFMNLTFKFPPIEPFEKEVLKIYNDVYFIKRHLINYAYSFSEENYNLYNDIVLTHINLDKSNPEFSSKKYLLTEVMVEFIKTNTTKKFI